MTNILVSGLINIETTLKVDSFPLTYVPVRFPFFGINTTVSGVGYNIAKALTILGDDVRFLSLIGRGFTGEQARRSLNADGIDDSLILDTLQETAQSVIIYDNAGARQIHTDLKDIQDQRFPSDRFADALNQVSLAILCNINYNRPFLALPRQRAIPLATDVHTIADVNDVYNRDYMAAADILFLSDESLPCKAEEFARRLQNRYRAAVIVIGLGGSGSLLAVREDNFMERIPAVKTRGVVSTIGAGDALFSCFNYSFARDGDPYEAIRKATIFASYKIGEKGAAEGFLSAAELERLATSRDYR